MIKALFIVLGTFFLGLGILGIVLPILPTTPFLLLTLYFYARGSKRFHTWFINTGLYEKHLKSFAENRAMTLKQKMRLMLFVDAMLLVSFIFVPVLIARVSIIILVIIKYIYFFTAVKTIKSV